MAVDVKEELTARQRGFLQQQEILRQEQYTLWLAMMVHENTKGKPMNFSRRPELVALYIDKAQEQVVEKSVQCGVSEYLIVYSFSVAEYGLSVFYVLPTIQVKQRFVANRIDLLLSRVPYYRELRDQAQGHTDNLSMKHYGQGTIIFCGTNTANDFIEFPADVKIVDELDRCNLDNLELADDRLTASEYKITKEVSNPTVVDYGIDARFKESDQKEYQFKCASCGHQFSPDWFKNVVREVSEGKYELLNKDHIVCHKCWRPVARENGTWVARYPDASISGYRISKIISPLHDLSKLYIKFTKALRSELKLQIFYNSDLGLAYSGRGVEVTSEMLEGLCDDYWLDGHPPSGVVLPTTMGIDVGTFLHVIIRDLEPPRRARFIGKLQTFEQVEELLGGYNIISAVVDALPETREASRFQERVGDLVWLCYYMTNNSCEAHFNENAGVLKVDRTFALDGLFGLNGDVGMGKVAMVNPRNAADLCGGEYYEQMKSLVRVLDAESATYSYQRRRDVDHFAHAENYCKLATQAPDLGYCGGVY